MSFKWWSALLSLYLCALASASADELRVCQQDPSKYAYRIELANLILARTDERYGELRIRFHDRADPAQDRCLALLADGLVDLAYVPPSDARLREFAVIPFDLHSGMLGYRLLLINRADAQRFASVNSLEDLRRFTGGFGSQWSDFPLFAHNRLPVVGVAQADNLLAMLNGRRFDYYHRGLHEAWREVAAHRDSYPLLMVEPHLPWPMRSRCTSPSIVRMRSSSGVSRKAWRRFVATAVITSCSCAISVSWCARVG